MTARPPKRCQLLLVPDGRVRYKMINCSSGYDSGSRLHPGKLIRLPLARLSSADSSPGKPTGRVKTDGDRTDVSARGLPIAFQSVTHVSGMDSELEARPERFELPTLRFEA